MFAFECFAQVVLHFIDALHDATSENHPYDVETCQLRTKNFSVSYHGYFSTPNIVTQMPVRLVSCIHSRMGQVDLSFLEGRIDY